MNDIWLHQREYAFEDFKGMVKSFRRYKQNKLKTNVFLLGCYQTLRPLIESSPEVLYELGPENLRKAFRADLNLMHHYIIGTADDASRIKLYTKSTPKKVFILALHLFRTVLNWDAMKKQLKGLKDYGRKKTYDKLIRDKEDGKYIIYFSNQRMSR